MIADIVLADDDGDLRKALSDWLRSRGHVVREAADGAQAFAMAADERPHLVIMDVVMTGLYGPATARKLEDFPGTHGIPVILMSGTTDQAALKDILKLPHIRFLRKPVDLKALDKTMRELLPEGGFTQ
ncbi:MAG: response regulator receiver protein [Elusimicrobia bacterium]|nr:MAG: response regulator receiver protein [Elusimicrobiota bacterium]